MEYEEEDNFQKIYDFLKLNKYKWIFFLLLVFLGLGVWAINPNCGKIFCKEFYFEIIHYVFLPFDFLLILVIAEFPSGKFALTIYRISYLLFQFLYWYIIACLLGIWAEKIAEKRAKNKQKKSVEAERKMQEAIKRDVEKAEVLEKQKKKK